MHIISFAACISTFALSASPAIAQLAEPASAPTSIVQGRATVYPAAYFATYAPTSALDIAQRIPGFQLDLGNGDVRGFAGAAGNVVISGSRPSSKSDTLQTILARIPAKRVIRVEVGPGDLYGADYSGKAQVLNVILSDETGIDGNVTLSAKRLFTGLIDPDVSASAFIKRGKSTLNLSAGSNHVRRNDEGTDSLIFLPSHEPFEFRRKANDYEEFFPYASANWALQNGPDRAIRANVRYSTGRLKFHQDNHVVPVARPERDDTLDQLYKNRSFEIGGDVTRPLAGGAIKLVGLATRRHRDNQDGALNIIGDDVLGGFAQSDVSSYGETIGRLVWSRSNLAGFSVETGGEIAFNKLDSQVDLFVIGDGGGRTRIDLPIDNAVVSEKRGEIYVNAGRNLSAKLRADARLTYERSRLTVSGDTEAKRSLAFLKPSLSLDWKPGGGWHIQLSAKRTVAQLNFYDFISVAELANDRVNGGNAELLPQRAWEARATIEHPILGDGLAKVELGYDKVSLLQDRILTEDGFDAPGNIGSGTAKFAAATIDAPLARLGLKGARLKLTGTVRDRSVKDPLSGRSRMFSDSLPKWQWQAEYRQDLAKFAYGLTVSDNSKITFFRIAELDSIFNGGPFATAFVEYRPSTRTTVTFDVHNLLSTHGQRERIYFFPNRSVDQPGAREFRDRNNHRSFGLTVKQAFD
ncbi:MAG: TonB-dependent receptor [Sphingomonas sp.]|uniref:TonB-dependent receptor n=1 Tax=Sphingomonas sp. TaxID=28214 RepID=UPI00179FBD65|nr:TonB-dependent receptor [Sphingomonas sp.]MBA3667043.1 TonB-dependent receptor [Sphingomonas sp.]